MWGDGKVIISEGIKQLGKDFELAALRSVRFASTNNEWADEGDFVVKGCRIIWRILYMNRTLDDASPDPSDPNVTLRVLHLTLPRETLL